MSYKIKLSNFELLKNLGSGGFGKVFLVRHLHPENQDLYAMKVLKKSDVTRAQTDIKHTWSERAILQKLDHPFLVKLHFAFQDPGLLYLVLEYCPGGELFSYMELKSRLDEASACFYVAEISLALGHLHTKSVIYRDLKPENVLFDRDGHCKIVDFNLAIETESTARTFCGTREYMAPEMYMRHTYDKNVDWWCLGVLLFDMVAGNPPWRSDDKTHLAQKILYNAVPMKRHFSVELRSLISQLLQKHPADRLGSGEADVEALQQHQFFSKHGTDWNRVFRREIRPPFQPHFSSAEDTSCFCQSFTSQPLRISQSQSVADDPFQNFSFDPEPSDWLCEKSPQILPSRCRPSEQQQPFVNEEDFLCYDEVNDDDNVDDDEDEDDEEIFQADDLDPPQISPQQQQQQHFFQTLTIGFS